MPAHSVEKWRPCDAYKLRSITLKFAFSRLRKTEARMESRLHLGQVERSRRHREPARESYRPHASSLSRKMEALRYLQAEIHHFEEEFINVWELAVALRKLRPSKAKCIKISVFGRSSSNRVHRETNLNLPYYVNLVLHVC